MSNKLVCPNYNSQEWKDLVGNVGVNKAHWIWNKIDGDTELLKPYLRSPAKIVRKVDDFLKELGFTVEPVRQIFTDKNVSPVAQVGMLAKIVQVVEGRADTSTLPEEAASVAIELLRQKESPLYYSMMKHILSTSEYKKTLKDYGQVYQNDIKVMEEAASKLIATRIVAKSQPAQTFEKVWWKKAIDYFKTVFTLSSTQTKDYFDEVVEWMESGELGIFQPVDKTFYQLTSKTEDQLVQDQTRFTKKLVDRNGVPTERYFEKTEKGLREVKHRVSDFVERLKAKNNFGKRTNDQKILDDLKRNTGITYHAFMEKSARSLIDSTGTIKQPLEYKKSGEKEEVRLYNYLVDLFKSLPAGTKIYPEQMIHNAVEDTAATLDLLAIDPDGRAYIYDYKFIDYNKDSNGNVIDSQASFQKREGWNEQMTRYRTILQKSYGIKEFGQTRMIPVSVTYDNNGKPIDFEIGNVSLTSDQKPYLDPVPAWDERTNSDEINEIIDKLTDTVSDLRRTTPKGSVEKERKSIRIRQLEGAIKDLQLRKNKDGIEAFARSEFKFVKDNLLGKPVSTISNEQLLWSMDAMDFLFNAKIDDDLHNIANTYRTGLKKLFNEWQVDRNVDSSTAKTGKKLFNATALDWLVPISQIRNRVFERFSKLKETVYDKTQKDVDAFNGRVKSLLDKLKSEGKDFDLLLEKDEKGKPTGNLVSKYSKDFWASKADNGSNYQVKESVDVIQEDGSVVTQSAQAWYDAKLAERELIWTQQLLNKEGNVDEDKVRSARRKFEYEYNVWSPDDKIRNSALKYKFNPLSEPKDQFMSPEYKKVLASPIHKQLYEEFTGITKLANKWSGRKLHSTFVPSMENSLIRKVIKAGVNLGNVGDNIVDALTYKDWERTEDSKGNIQLKIPLHFTNDLKGEKNLDLAYVFSQFAQSVYMNKYLQDVEDESYLLLRTLQDGQYHTTNARGYVKEGYEGASSDTIELFKRFQQTYVYGIHDFNKDIEVAGLSVNKIRQGLQSTFSKVSLGFNVFSAVGNLGGGLANASIMALSGSRYFNGEQFRRSLVEISGRNEKAKNLIDNLKVRSDHSNYRWGKQHMTLDTLTKHSTDSVYVLQNVGEYIVQNGVMLAMLKNYTVKDGKLTRIEKGDKSLYDLAGADGTLKGSDNNPLPEDIQNEFKRKVRGVNLKLMGSLNERDVIQIQQTVMGNMFFQFKRWVLPMGAARFGSLKKDQLTDEWEEGRFRSGLKLFTTKKFFPVVTDLVSILSPGANGLDWRFKELYEQAIHKNPELRDQLDYEQFKRIMIENIRGSIGELAIYALVFATYLAFKPDDDEEEISAEHSAVAVALLRVSRELSYWTSLDSLDTQMTVPLVSAILQVKNAMWDGLKLIYAGTTDDDELAKSAKPGEKFLKFVPIVNSYNRLMKDLNLDNDE